MVLSPSHSHSRIYSHRPGQARAARIGQDPMACPQKYRKTCSFLTFSVETYKKYCVLLILLIWGWIPKRRRQNLCSKTSYKLRSASFAIAGDVQKPSKKLWFSSPFLRNY
jgi:hypothetical protein